MPLTEKQKAALEAKKAQTGKKQQQHNETFAAAMQASDQIDQYNQDLGNCVDTTLAGKGAKKGGGCEIM